MTKKNFTWKDLSLSDFKVEDVINRIKENAEIIDISTDDGDLEDIFIELTNN